MSRSFPSWVFVFVVTTTAATQWSYADDDLYYLLVPDAVPVVVASQGAGTGPILRPAHPIDLLEESDPMAIEELPPHEEEHSLFFQMNDLVDHVIKPTWEGWHGTIDFGVSGSQGNSENLNLNGRFRAKYKGTHAVHSYGLSFLDRKSRDQIIARRATIDMRIEWHLPDSPWSYFVSGRNEYDAKKTFDFRINAVTGIGYELFSTDIANMITRLGGSVSREVGTPEDAYIPEISSSFEWHRQWGPQSDLGMEVEYFPSVIEMDDFRFYSTVFYAVQVHPDWKMRIKFSVTDRYDSKTQSEYRNDLDYSAVFSWKY